jgi:hypothetical protein
MALVIRHSETEHLLRSTDEPPGVIGFGQPDTDGRFSFYVHPSWEPSAAGRAAADALSDAGIGGTVAEHEFGVSAADFPGVPIDTTEAFEGCTSARAAIALYRRRWLPRGTRAGAGGGHHGRARPRALPDTWSFLGGYAQFMDGCARDLAGGGQDGS